MIVECCKKLLNKHFLHQFVRSFSVHHNLSVKPNSQKLSIGFYRNYSHLNRNYLTPNSNTGLTLIPIQIRNLTSEEVSELDVDEFASSLSSDYFQIISSSKPVTFVQDCLLDLHSTSGLPWWGTIVCSALIIKAITFPISVFQAINTAKLENVYGELNTKVEVLKKEASFAVSRLGWTPDKARREYTKAFNKEYKELVIRDNCHPGKNIILVLFQLPIWLSLTFAIRNLCFMLPISNMAAQITLLELSVGGFGWMRNLSIADPYFITPIMLLLFNLGSIEVQRLFHVQQRVGKLAKFGVNFSRFFAVVIAGISCCLPTAMNIYWIVNSFLNILQNLLLKSPTFKGMMRIPETDSDLKNPYQYAYYKLKSKFEK